MQKRRAHLNRCARLCPLLYAKGAAYSGCAKGSSYAIDVYKRQGLNTGGMGTVAPNPYYTEDMARVCMETIFLPTMEAMNAENRTFRGCLYFGLMLTRCV